MKLTTRSEYALLSLIYMARRGGKGFIKVEDICDEYGISKKYLEHILFALKQKRLITARRGSRGGYKLIMPARKISVADIIRLMDGALAPTLAVSKYFFSHTPLEKEKKTIKFFKEMRDYISDRVEKLKIADLV